MGNWRAEQSSSRYKSRLTPGSVVGRAALGLLMLASGTAGALATERPSPAPAAPPAAEEGGAPSESSPPREAPGADRDPELIDPGPEGCPFNDQELQLIV